MILRRLDSTVTIAIGTGEQPIRSPLVRLLFELCRDATSKKLSHVKVAVALHFAWYNFVRVHKNLGVTPAVQAGLTDDVRKLAELL